MGGEHLMDLSQGDAKQALRAQELHFSPIEVLLGNRVRQWSIWHLSTCSRLQDTPIPHMQFSYQGLRTVAKHVELSKEYGLVMDVKLNKNESTFIVATMLEPSWEYLPFTSRVTPPCQGPLKIDSE